MLIKEGEVQSSNERIVYPTITSCLTVTCIFTGPRFVGGHCVKVPTRGQLGYQAVVQEIKNKSPDQGRVYVYFVGAIPYWNAAEKSCMYQTLQADEPIDIDTTPFNAVDVEFLPTGFVNLLKAGTHQILYQRTFGQR